MKIIPTQISSVRSPPMILAAFLVACFALGASSCSSDQKTADAPAPAKTMDAVAAQSTNDAKTDSTVPGTGPDQSPNLSEQVVGHDDLWSLIHFGSKVLPTTVGGIENVAELAIVVDSTGEVSGLIDFEACLKNEIPTACTTSDVPGIFQDMTKEAGPIALKFEDLYKSSRVVMVFAVPAAIELNLRQNWKMVAGTYITKTWKSLVSAVVHFAVMSKYENFLAAHYTEDHWVKMLKRWNSKVVIPDDWIWHERIAIFMDPNLGALKIASANKKAWLKSVRQSPFWIWNGLIETAAHHTEDRSVASAYGWKEQLQAIRTFEDLRLPRPSADGGNPAKVTAAMIRDQENIIHKFQKRMQGSPNCWSRFRVTFRRITNDALAHKELTDDQMKVLNGKGTQKDQATLLKTLDPESSAAHAVALNLDLYRDEETRPLVFQFDGMWANWMAGLKSRGMEISDDLHLAPMLECSQKYEK